MTNYPKIAEINCETGETLVREQTEEERVAYDLAQQELDSKIQTNLESQAAKAAAQAKLAALGLTTDDLNALGLGGNE